MYCSYQTYPPCMQGSAALANQMVLPVDTPRMPVTPRTPPSVGLAAVRSGGLASPSASPVSALHSQVYNTAIACVGIHALPTCTIN